MSTDEQDLSAQLAALAELGVGDDRIYVDKGLTGTNRARPGLREALAACRAGDQLVVTKLDRLAGSVTDGPRHRQGADRPAGQAQPRRLDPRPDRRYGKAAVHHAGDDRRVRGGPDSAADPRGHEDRQGQRPVAGQGAQAERETGAHLVALHKAGEHTSAELAELFGVARSTVYRAIERATTVV